MGKNNLIDISVIIATRNRACLLERALASLQQQRLEGLVLEIIVVDNGSDDGTKSVQNRAWSDLNIVSLYEAVPGKSRSLNRALKVARGDLVVFTDDDITAAHSWLADLHRASIKFPSVSIFCGPIVPCFPAGTPEWIRTHPDSSGFFGRFEPQLDEGWLPPDIFPVGANFAVKKSALVGVSFRLDLGPSRENGPLLGEDTEFVNRLRLRFRDCIYVPSASVLHHIAPDRTTPSWIFERAFHLGRASILVWRRPVFAHSRYQLNDGSGDSQTIQFVKGGLLNHYCGQLWECSVSREFKLHEEELRKALMLLGIESHQHLLGTSGRMVFAKAYPGS